MRRLLLTSALAALPLLGAAGPANDDIVSIRLLPQIRTLSGKNASQQYIVMAKTADGGERDVTEQTHFSLEYPETAAMKETGRVVATQDGETKVRASFGSHTSEATLRYVWK